MRLAKWFVNWDRRWIKARIIDCFWWCKPSDCFFFDTKKRSSELESRKIRFAKLPCFVPGFNVSFWRCFCWLGVLTLCQFMSRPLQHELEIEDQHFDVQITCSKLVQPSWGHFGFVYIPPIDFWSPATAKRLELMTGPEQPGPSSKTRASWEPEGLPLPRLVTGFSHCILWQREQNPGWVLMFT